MTAPASSGAAAPEDSRANPRPLTLQEAVDLAQRASPAAVQAKGQERIASAGNRSAVAAFLPGLSLSAGATRNYPSGEVTTRVENGVVVVVPGQPWSFNGSVGANVDLFDGGARYFEIRRARAAAGAAAAGAVSERYAIALDVKQRYFDVLAARESEAAAQAQLAQAEWQFRAAVARVQARSATRSDSLRAEIQVRTARLAVLEARLALDTANAALARAVGVAYYVTAVAVDSTAAAGLAVDDETLRQLAENGPAVQEAKSGLDAARASKGSAWSGYLPTITAGYSRSASGVGEEFAGGADSYSYTGALRLSLSLPIFNQLQREERVVRARVAEDNADVALRDARLAALQGLVTALGAFRTAGQRIDEQAASVASAEEDLRVQQERYAVGSATMLDVLASQTTLVQARQQLIRARYDQRVARAQLEALVGRDL
jgi:outer membrane protein